MKKFYLFTKTLLVATILLVGGANSAWADKNYSQIFKYTFEDSETYQQPWTITNSNTSQLEISSDKKIKFIPNAANTLNSQVMDFETSVTGITDYKFSFDYAFSPTGTSQSGTGLSTRILTIYDSDDVELFHLECAASGDNNATTTNVKNASGTTIGSITTGARFADPTASSFYTFTITADETDGVVLSIKDYAGNAVSLTNSTLNASFKLAAKIESTPHIGKYSGSTYPQFNARAAFDNVYFGEAVTGDVATEPTLALTGFEGTSRIFQITCLATETIHYQVKDGDTEKQSGAGASVGASVNVTVPAGQKLIAWTTMGGATSSNVEITVTGGTPVLTAPTITLSDIGADYNKSYTVSNLTQTITEGVYSYEFQPDNLFYATSSEATSGTNISDNKFSLTAAGTYYVIVSKEGATSANTQVDNTIKYLKSASYDFTKSSILTAAWTDATGTEKWADAGDAEAYKENSVSTSSSTALFDGFTVSDAGSRLNKIHWHNGKGAQFVNGSGNFTIGLTSVPENAIIRNTYYQGGSNRYELGNTITIGRHNKSGEKQGIVAIDVYTPDPISLAIADCKSHETSDAFATAIDGESFASADEVYAFHTSWQIAKADAASSNDITKVIFDAAVSDFSRWNNARNNSGEAYTEAPDTKYFDAWNNEASDAKQKIYGLPAGTYTLKVATRASEDVTDKSKYNVWVNGGSANVSVLGSHIGSTGGTLGNGWNWTILSFTLDAEADVQIGFYSCPPTERWAGCDDFHLYKGMLAENVSVTVSEAGYATLVSPYALNFTSTDIKAYRAVVDTEKGIVNLEKENQIPSNTPVVLYYAGGKTENIPVIGAADALGDNDLKAGTGGAVVTGTNPYNYILNNIDDKVGFYKAAGKTVAADRAYLQTTYTSSGARGMILVIDDEKITGISEAKAEAEFAKEGKFVVDGKLVIFKKGMKFNANGQVIK